MSILEELWYGNIDPMEAIGSGGSRYKELMELMARNREKITVCVWCGGLKCSRTY